MSDLTSGIVTVLLAIIGVAIIAVLVSGQARTREVIQAGGGAVSGILGSALAPVVGGGFAGGGTGSLF
jgi:hypothetical protein